MIEREKKARLIAHLKLIADEGDFVELPPLSFKVVIDRKTLNYLSELPEKSQRLIKEKCHALAKDPFRAKKAIKSCCIWNSSYIDFMWGDHSQCSIKSARRTNK
jgi:hypothetical protein